MPAALVTGAASGIGRATARTAPAPTVSTSCRVDLREAGVGTPFAADLTTREGNAGAVSAAVDAFGRLDVVVANAGIQHVAPVRDFPEDRWDTILALLLTSPFLLAKYAWTSLPRRATGRFIAVASVHALVASPYKAAYVAGQARRPRPGQDARARGRRRRHHRDRRLPRLRPHAAGRRPAAPTRRRRTASARSEVLEDVILAPHAVKRLIEPEEVAAMIAFLAGPSGGAFTGVPVTMDLGWTAR